MHWKKLVQILKFLNTNIKVKHFMTHLKVSLAWICKLRPLTCGLGTHFLAAPLDALLAKIHSYNLFFT